ncbi:MAG: YD repeat-containing protein [Candidatus Pedobacter colombiensis]|uniref:YD repeat-containing protein n=1 Tax=Candidatus Pedobacter colombiensis TaxID=3121371 RepID=A0AAJ6B7D5_9SPHI|nr:RHS repeat domain-containing protein [Pedobacter sp.]WEK17958.1 MAG: YD repeat-containing protein [Pedobacter sp.]
MRNNILPLLLLSGSAIGSFAQTAAPTDLYLKTMNSYLSPSPESAQLMKYQDYPVNLFTGTPQVSIPIYTASGKGISIPVTLSYHAAGGVKVDDQATAYGLGFSLICGGEISREMRGGADEGALGTTGYLNKPLKMWEYVQKYNNGMGTYADQQLWVDAMNGTWDVEPDIFYFSFGAYSGKFVYDDVPAKFVCIDESSHLNITFDRSNMPNSAFTIVTDDGNTYIFSARETSRSQVRNVGFSPSIAPAGPEIPTSWKLTKIINADKTDSLMLDYVGQLSSYWTTGANIDYETRSGAFRYPVLSFSNTTIGGQAKLSKIRGTNFSVDFIDETADRQDLPAGNKALSKIVIKNGSNEVQDLFVLHHSYFDRTYPIGPMPVAANSTLITKSLRLDSISEYGNSESNPLPIRHAFSYNQTPMPARLSFAKDWWGYANYNTFEGSLIPPYVTGTNILLAGANRKPNFDRTVAGILTAIRLPTGGTVNYEYEPNTTASPVEQASLPQEQLMTVDQMIQLPEPGSSTIGNMVTKSFTINVPPNATLNNNQGGVIATISCYPNAPNPTPGSNNAVYGTPYYTLSKTSNIPGVAGGSYSGSWQAGGAFGVYLPNGNYTMTYNNNGYIPPTANAAEGEPPGGQFVYFNVSYNVPDPNAPFPNYGLAGVRVKSITTLDPYSKMTQKRRFRYHDPVTDSSYGVYIGNARNSFWEVSQNGQWIVRNGSFNMPGQGNVSNSIVYPKVMEEVSDNGVTYRTEHYYSCRTIPSYPTGFPLAPPLDFATSRGNEEKTVMDKYTGSGFVPAAVKIQKWNDTGVSLSNGTAFSHPIQAMKCSATSYDVALVIQQGFAPPIVGVYDIAIGNRLYLDADSTITYDLNNANNKITEWHDYKYGDYNLQPIVVRSGNSDGSVNIQKNYYATDVPETNTVINANPIAQMVSSNRITMPLGTKQFKDAQLLSQQYSYTRFDGSKLLVDSMRQSLLNSDPETEIKVLQYDDATNPLSIEMRGNKYRKYIWNKAKGLPIATAMVPKGNAAFAFTSFEYPGEYTWTESSRSPYGAFAGNYFYDLHGGPVTCPDFYADGGVDVYVWAAYNGDVKVNNLPMQSTGRTNGSWTLYTRHIDASDTHPFGYFTTLVISGTAFIDNLVALPTGSVFQGNVYDNSNRVTAVVNEQIATSFYEYDAYGRLKSVKDEQGNLIKSTSYQYQGTNN